MSNGTPLSSGIERSECSSWVDEGRESCCGQEKRRARQQEVNTRFKASRDSRLQNQQRS